MAGRGLQAKPIVQEAIDRLEPLITYQLVSSDQATESTAALAQAYVALSQIELHFGDVQDAIAAQRKSLELLSNPKPTTFAGAMAAAQAHYGMAILYEKVEYSQKAIEEFFLASAALELAEEIQHGKVPLEFLSYRSQIAFHQCILLRNNGRNARAAEVMKVQVTRDADLIAKSHAPHLSLGAYQRSVDFLQALYVEQGDPWKAFELCQSWIAIAKSVTAAHEQSVEARYFSTMAQHLTGHLEEQLGRPEKAMQYYQEALEHFKQVEPLAMGQPSFLHQKIELEIHVFLLNTDKEPFDKTEPIFERAVQATRVLKGLPLVAPTDLKPAIDQLRRGVDAMRKADNEAATRWESILQAEQLW